MVLTISTTPKMMSHPLQCIAEATEGTTPGSGSAVVLPTKTVDINIDGKWESVDIFKDEDLADEVRVDTVQGFRTSGPVDANAWAQFKWLLNSQSFTPTAGTIWEPKSFITGIKLQGSTDITYLVWKGVKPNSGTLKIVGGKLDTLDIEYSCVDFADPSTSAPAGVTLSTTFPTSGWYRGGDSNAVFTWNGTEFKYREASVNVNRNLDRVMAGGADVPFTLAPMGREITMTIKALWNNLTLYNDWKAQTKRTCSLGVASSKAITSGTSLSLLKKCGIPIDGGSNEVQPQSWEIRLFTASA